jgi:hypothetical protein
MLPSGNDAAHCLAEYFGGILKKEYDLREKEEMDKRKLEEEKAAAEALETPEDGEKANLSNSASNAYL